MPDEPNTALHNLGQCKDPEMIQWTLNVAVNEAKAQDIRRPCKGDLAAFLMLPLLLGVSDPDAQITHPPRWYPRPPDIHQKKSGTSHSKSRPGIIILGNVVQIVSNNFSSPEVVDDRGILPRQEYKGGKSCPCAKFGCD